MKRDAQIETFLSQYDEQVFKTAFKLREVLFANLPDVLEQVDLPARMIAYCYGQKYIEMICTIIPSKKGLKLGFYRGVDLPDPDHILEGTGKISRYVIIMSEQQIKSSAIKKLLKAALAAYRKRIAGLKK
jgi:hypothetical protein